MNGKLRGFGKGPNLDFNLVVVAIVVAIVAIVVVGCLRLRLHRAGVAGVVVVVPVSRSSNTTTRTMGRAIHITTTTRHDVAFLLYDFLYVVFTMFVNEVVGAEHSLSVGCCLCLFGPVCINAATVVCSYWYVCKYR